MVEIVGFGRSPSPCAGETRLASSISCAVAYVLEGIVFRVHDWPRNIRGLAGRLERNAAFLVSSRSHTPGCDLTARRLLRFALCGIARSNSQFTGCALASLNVVCQLVRKQPLTIHAFWTVLP